MAVSEPRCHACGGTRQAFPEEYDGVPKMNVFIHADNGCLACRVPLVKLARGYGCQQDCEPRSEFVQAWQDRDGTRWATYRCVTKGHDWDTTLKRQDYAMLTAAPRLAPAALAKLESV